MGKNEKIRTEDVVEIFDVKIITAEAHDALDVVQRENYDSVLNKITARTLSPAQKEAFDNTLTVPSATNPVVLKNDLATYVPDVDLGNLKDAVGSFADLPNPFTRTGDTLSGSKNITSMSSLTAIKVGQTVTGLGIDPDSTVTEIFSPSTIKIKQNATATASAVVLTFSPTIDDLVPVLADNMIYRWNGTAWLPFIRTGTLNHTELLHQNDDAQYQHLTLAEKTLLLDSAHQHSNKVVLDAIYSAGSGHIITTDERNRLPAQNEKDALVGTSGNPSSSNPYVTNIDPRLNTVRNPYVTIGPPGSLATYQGVDYRPYEDAILALTIGSATSVKAIEVLPGFYTFGGVVIRWDTQPEAIVIENFTPGTATLSFQTFQAGIQGLNLPGTGALIIRGFRFELNDLGTCGVLTQRPYSLIEDCVFTHGPTTSINQFGVTIEGANSTIRRCRFYGEITKGVEVKAPGCRIEECSFEFTNSSNYAIDVYPSGDNVIIDHCHFQSGRIRIQATALQSMIANNHFTLPDAGIIDLGQETRILQNQPQDINQPFLGKRRSVGPTDSYADFRGLDHVPVMAALADPNCTVVEMLPGTYTFDQTVVVPAGKSVVGYSEGGQTFIQGTNLTPALFSLENFTSLEGLYLTESGGGSCVVAPGRTGIKLKALTLDLSTSTALGDFCLLLSSCVDGVIEGCHFKGVRGLSSTLSNRMRIQRNRFENSYSSLSGLQDHIEANIFEHSSAPSIGGTNLIVTENHFLGSLPTKLLTTGSIWRANWPAPTANNDAGVDSYTLSLGDYGLFPVIVGATYTNFIGCGVIAYTDNALGASSTLPIQLPGRVNRLAGFNVKIVWTSPNSTSGAVVWEVKATYRDAVSGIIGNTVTLSSISPRSSSVETDETSTTLTFLNTQYGLPIGVDPTHVTIIVTRTGTAPADSLSAPAYLLSASLTLPRD